MLIQNFYYYLANQDELVKQYNGKYLVISDKKVVYSSPDDADAFNKGMEIAGLGNFIINFARRAKRHIQQNVTRRECNLQTIL